MINTKLWSISTNEFGANYDSDRSGIGVVSVYYKT